MEERKDKEFLEIGKTTLPKGHSLSISGVEPTLKTFPVAPPTGIMNRVKDFLPLLEKSNAELPADVAAQGDADMEGGMSNDQNNKPKRYDPYWNGDVQEGQPHIEMDLNFLPFEVTEDALVSAAGIEETAEQLLAEDEPRGNDRKRSRRIEEMN